MPNPFFQSQYRTVNPNVNNMANNRSIYNMLMNSRNPVALFNSMAQTNPQLKPIANMLSQGMTPQTIFNSMCEQRGINPDEFMKNLQTS